jgi:nitrogen regulatory protein PII
MKWIIAIIQPHRLDAVRDALGAIDIQGLTVSEVRGYGRQRGHTEIYRGAEYQISYVPKLKLEMAVDDDVADKVTSTIQDAAQTGKIGDGKVFVLDLLDALRIRTGEFGSEAL